MSIQKLKVSATSTFGNDYTAAESFMALMKETGLFFDGRCRNFINCTGYDKWSEYIPDEGCHIGGFRVILNTPDSRFSLAKFFQVVYENQLTSFLRLHGFKELTDSDEYMFHTFEDKYGVGKAALETGVHLGIEGTSGYIALIGEDANCSILQLVLSLRPINRQGLYEMLFRICYDYSQRII